MTTPRRTPTRPRRRVASLALLAALAGCTAPATPAPAPPARPPGVATTPTTDATGGVCPVRRSLPPDPTPPRRILDRGELVAGVDPSDATMSHWDASSQRFEGFNIELMLAVARALWPADDPRNRLTFKAVPPGQGAFAMLDKGEIDVVATSLTASCERARRVLFSNDYLDSGQTVLVRRNADGTPEFAGMEQLGGRRVCAATDTTSLAMIAGYRTAGGLRPVPVHAPHPVDCLVMLRQGQVDGVSTDDNILLGFARMAPDTTLVTEAPRPERRSCDHHRDENCTWFTDEPHAFAFRLTDGRELVAFVNHVLAQPRTAVVWQQAHDRWLAGHRDRGMPSPGPVTTGWPPPDPSPAAPRPAD
ncbi:transporter substrate-binding domain-containing protein [Micromonospora sp. DSM 115977]|uniref:Transporter substrate-binding domain-containing protein n=1 Tax=Micromonospora reichwaldensis TaxID=3075516 RepID=A0ABU2WQW7_9ACTN|nr:transporter substrate-binding domain-containing protein [Micromonospora sp. DSM 115977]MDT0527756.1 transporter substrate-binding domain-containing protein [Micromonospora sp. DSM 115977]